jgi:hypothetical protein
LLRVEIGEYFPVLVSLFDESTGKLASGKTVYYDIRDMLDATLSPPVSGTLTESIIEGGIYKTTVQINSPGMYICYATCSGFISSTEEILVNQENIYNVVKQTHNYNISVEDVPRTTVSGSMTPSQIIRNVPYLKTDFIITRVKQDSDSGWNGTVISGTTYAWYHSTDDDLPYMMAGSGV